MAPPTQEVADTGDDVVVPELLHVMRAGLVRLATAAGCHVEGLLRDTEVEKIRAVGVGTGFPLLVRDAEAPEI
jgi:hypothetical protein